MCVCISTPFFLIQATRVFEVCIIDSMVERRKPLVLSSTKLLINSVLSSSRRVTGENLVGDDVSPSLQLPAGILRFSKDKIDISDAKFASLDDSALLGLSTCVLKQLSVTSGSLVLVKNAETTKQRIAQVVVLDPPTTRKQVCDGDVHSKHSSPTMLTFPSIHLPQDDMELLDRQVAYLSPLLAFNLDLHISSLKFLVHQGKEVLESLFIAKVDDGTSGQDGKASLIKLGLQSVGQLPKYASHLRVSFVKIPECGTLESLKGSSAIEAEDRQEKIDLALHNYFEVDRYLARGDVFSVCINWNCSSMICIPCRQRLHRRSDNIIYFKVVAVEPSEETVLRVNCTKTALVLGGSIPSALPPDLLISGSNDFVPLQGDTVKILASILAPTLCPSVLSLKFRVAVLLHGLPGCGKRTVVRYVARRLGIHVVEYSCHNLMASSERKTSAALAQAFNTAQSYSPTILLLRDFDVFRNLVSNESLPNDQVGLSSEVASVIREFTEPSAEDEDEESHGYFPVKEIEKICRQQVLLVAAADSSEGLPPTIRRCFSHEISMGPLTEQQRVEMLSQLLQPVSELTSDTGSEEFVKDIIGQTSGFMPRDLHALVADAGANLIRKSNSEVDKNEPGESDLTAKVAHNDNSSIAATQVMGKEDLVKAMERSKKRNASALGAPKLPLLHKDLFSSGLRKRSGVLLYGPPGTGKTLLAKAVATECSLNFLSVKGPELINMYIGESEKNVRDIFQKARSARPCVIFFDELDSLAPARGASGDSGGVMDRVVSQMLAEIDGLNDSSQDLFIIGASNRPDLIDPALLRPGRFDKLLYVGVNSDVSYRERVLKALTRKFKLLEDVSLYSIAKKCPPNFTGADMYALCADAWFHAAKRKVLSSDSNSDSSRIDQADSVVVEYDDFVKVLRELSPSLSMAELKKYELLRDQFEGSSN
ncbi:hypothetical protein CISIN_1g002159mg [Citrus sinensis]|uniref:Peroxisomal ATPase PEX6 n=1 Tax=Citrus sinensis TaxID=2711 RepID=A0A067H5Q9_CITSI|nr:hypothetical protein CISIN_1g002159mg [Citrus sinensis]